MIVSIELPDKLANQLHLHEAQADRRVLEMVALEGYRSGELSRGEVGELLGIGFHETEQFLKRHHAEIDLTLEEFDRSSTALDQLLAR